MLRIINYEGRLIELRYFMTTSHESVTTYSTEVKLSPEDKIIIDGITPWKLENKIQQLLPALIQSRETGVGR
ncbi:MAG: hypothetical protein JSU92_02645 [Deltaproteobacteria bacterium]|nr:MAG: hypothetical protein JSU92_02645 [Deltaproteobacteria bacterium]